MTTATPHKSSFGWGIATIGALSFLISFLANVFVMARVTDDSLPLPDAPNQEVHDFFVDNPAASWASGAISLVSAAGLLVFVIAATSVVRCRGETDVAGRSRIAGLVAVALLATSAVLSFVLAVIADTASVDTVNVVRDANFLTGGAIHVAILGVFAILLSQSRAFGSRTRNLGKIAGGLAIAAILSIAIYYASIFIPVGRVLVMIWTVVASIMALRASAAVRRACDDAGS